jgi:hypothetical protein
MIAIFFYIFLLMIATYVGCIKKFPKETRIVTMHVRIGTQGHHTQASPLQA